jgi:hypothetical protein
LYRDTEENRSNFGKQLVDQSGREGDVFPGIYAAIMFGAGSKGGKM